MKVSSTLGVGFLEKVYENALRVELTTRGHRVQQQQPIEVRYGAEIVGDYFADLIVDDKVVVELKASQALERVHYAQCLNYLKGTGLQLALLLNFGRPRLEYHRIAN
jgi:GxxExxY protein